VAFLCLLIMSLIYYSRFVILALAPLADDVCIMRLVIALELGTTLASDFIMDWGRHAGLLRFPCHELALTCTDVWFFFGFVRAALSRRPMPMQRRMWFTLHLWMWMNIVVDVCTATCLSFVCRSFSHNFCWVPGELMLTSIIAWPGLRQHFHMQINTSFENTGEKRAAAGVAGLLGSCSVEDVIAQAASRFRSVRLTDLSFEDLKDNRPNPALFVKTTPAMLHCCDAFVSHSWHDDAQAKWAAIQRWRRAFVAAHSREPKVWVDKCCIDQSSVETDLPCLPIFLSGCHRMVVFCGPTYLSRLWCIMEIFTFVHIGRGVNKIDFELVERAGHEDEDMRSVERCFEEFDAEQCECFLAEDKERMLSIIHAAFGAMAGFNRAVRDIFRRSRIEEALLRGRSNSASASICSADTDASSSSGGEEDSSSGGEGTGNVVGPFSGR